MPAVRGIKPVSSTSGMSLLSAGRRPQPRVDSTNTSHCWPVKEMHSDSGSTAMCGDILLVLFCHCWEMGTKIIRKNHFILYTSVKRMSANLYNNLWKWSGRFLHSFHNVEDCEEILQNSSYSWDPGLWRLKQSVFGAVGPQVGHFINSQLDTKVWVGSEVFVLLISVSSLSFLIHQSSS